MSRESEREVITAHFQSSWSASYGKVAYPNHEFETPKNELFAVFNIVDRGTTRESIGRTYLKRSRGTLQIDIYTPLNQGSRRSREIAEIIENIYDSLTLVTSDNQQIQFYTPSSRSIATNEQRAANLDDNWDRYVIECPFTRSQTVYK